MNTATFALSILCLVGAGTLRADCTTDERYAILDFWIGEWDVYSSEQRIGANRIEKILSGCAITESWLDRRGGEGSSLFYFDPIDGAWNQVWVTDIGTMKEKRLVAVLSGGAVRFQGRVLDASGKLVHDRTTLTPVEGGVRQVIEQSDDGETWRVGADLKYVRRKQK